MVDMILIALCCASISFTITVTSIFRKFREWASKKHPKLEELVHCPWCLGHYIVLLVLLVCSDYSSGNFADFLIAWFGIVGMMGMIHWVLLRAYEPVAKVMVQRKLDKLNEDKD